MPIYVVAKRVSPSTNGTDRQSPELQDEDYELQVIYDEIQENANRSRIETTPNAVYGVSTDDIIMTTPNKVYGVVSR